MQIETKFDIGDTVFFIEENKVQQATIKRISINVNESNSQFGYGYKPDARIRYSTDSSNLSKYKNEEQLFKTKQDLLDSL